MTGALYAVVSGGLAAVERLEITANNLANANTAGFKALQLLIRAEEPVPTTGGFGTIMQGLSGTVPTVAYETVTDTSQGSIRDSGNPLDMAIAGPGFFAVTTPNGERYTRQGEFQLGPNGTLVTAVGDLVQDDGGREIRLPEGRISVDADGGIAVDDAHVATLRLVQFAEPERLLPQGGSLFAATPDAVPLDVDRGETRIVSEAIELSNVDAIKGLLELINVARGYEAYIRAMQQVDGTVETAIERVGGTT